MNREGFREVQDLILVPTGKLRSLSRSFQEMGNHEIAVTLEAIANTLCDAEEKLSSLVGEEIHSNFESQRSLFGSLISKSLQTASSKEYKKEEPED